MAIVVNIVIEPGDATTEGHVINACVDFVDELRVDAAILGGSIVGLTRTVDLTPATTGEADE